MAGKVTEITDATFAAQVTGSKGLVMVDFWAPWCGPCRQVAPVVEKMAERFAGKITILKLDTEANQATAQSMGIRSIPTFGFFLDGKPMLAISGARGERDFAILIERVIQFKADPQLIQKAYEADRGVA